MCDRSRRIVAHKLFGLLLCSAREVCLRQECCRFCGRQRTCSLECGYGLSRGSFVVLVRNRRWWSSSKSSCRFPSGIASSCGLYMCQTNDCVTAVTQLRVFDALQQPVATLQAEVSSFGFGCKRHHDAVPMRSLRGFAPALHASGGCAECRLSERIVGGLSADHTEGPLMCCCTFPRPQRVQ